MSIGTGNTLNRETGIDPGSSVESFEKVRDGLEGAVGKLILLYKPEVVANYGDGDKVERRGSLGVLHAPPGFNKGETGLLLDIFLPTYGHVHNFSDFREEGISFNCINSDDIGISDSDKLKSEISIYVGRDVIEDTFFSSSMPQNMDYFNSMNLLKCPVSDKFFSRNEDEIRMGRDMLLKDLRGEIIAGLPDFAEKRKWRFLYDEILKWGVEDSVLKLDEMISTPPVGEYVKGKL